MLDHTPRVAAIHDLSGLGRCSLTVAMPVLSVMGCQCAPLPTAVLSSQTGGVTGYTFLDMTDQMGPIAAHWKAVDARFDAVYTGFLGSERQIGLVESFFDDFAGKDTLLLVDPVMGDDGAAYDTYGEGLIAGMRHLAGRADIITPNFTEAAFLLGLPGDALKNGTVTPEEAVRRLSMEGRRSVVLTGYRRGANTGSLCLDAADGTVTVTENPCVELSFPGTGDLFASVLCGGLMQGRTLAESAALAENFVHDCIVRTAERGLPRFHGVDFEPLLGKLLKD
ncbi:MAG: pyridoxamine kinase [Clostridia bacterium]|nr:pyridoxamine kinase [Clostridia bacterium]